MAQKSYKITAVAALFFLIFLFFATWAQAEKFELSCNYRVEVDAGGNTRIDQARVGAFDPLVKEKNFGLCVSCATCPSAGNPVNFATGNKYEMQRDFSLHGPAFPWDMCVITTARAIMTDIWDMAGQARFPNP